MPPSISFSDEQKRLIGSYYPGLGVVPPNVGSGGLLGIIETAVNDALAELSTTVDGLGDLGDLTTGDQDTAVEAINEVDAHADALAGRESGLLGVSSETKLLADITALRTTLAAAVVDVTALRATLAAAVVDIAAQKAALDTLVTKLNADAGVADTNYASSGALTGAAPSAVTATAPAALTAAVPGTTVFGQGGTAGRIKLLNNIEFDIAGQHYRKAPADNVWDLSALGTTDGTHYKAVRLYLDSSGTGTVDAGTAATSAALAKAALPALDPTKACVGAYVMGLSGNFANALDAQGSYVDGWAVAAF